MTTIKTKFFGDEARRIEKYLELDRNGNTVDVDTKISFTLRVIEGRSHIEMKFDIMTRNER